ncbi:MAG: Lipopolysaccharide heptosyltransferase I (EC [uncultured Sulfurovum sp.]|uniref:Lipopolysaccharide heptosyltransferase 1 n=1 Tax=uncultured Sulfurovum sp. TaxID=269237 RepID=A0A6S6SSH3_9BACT|nr:MAG: Lipopolysaccharide heptosyltransferase I (EC [uncultured Sulfurovum sp.]
MKIAIVKLSAMGDIIHAMVALQYIKEAHPDIKIDWIVEQGFASVLEGNPHIDNILTLNLKSIKKDKSEFFSQIKKVKRYAKNNYNLVLDAQGLIKSALTAKLLGKKRAGFSKESIREGVASYFYNQKVEIAYDANTIDRNATILSEPLNFRITSQMIIDKKPFLFYQDEDAIIYNYLSTEKRNIIFVIGSTWESRNYPKEKFAEIANTLQENVLIAWGSEEEKQKAEWIEANSNHAKVLPKINLNTLKAVIAKSDLLIGNDTGPTHMAWGLNIPSITIFGPTPINRVYQTSINKVIKSHSKINHYKLNKNDFSINEIDSNEITLIAKELLNA